MDCHLLLIIQLVNETMSFELFLGIQMKLMKRYYCLKFFLFSIAFFAGISGNREIHAEQNNKQLQSSINELPYDETAKMERVGKDVYVIIHEDATDNWPHSNVGIIVGDKEVMVIDADYLPSRARADIALIRKLTLKPVKYLVYTHWHFDHNNGAIAYVDSFPNIKIISEKESQKYVELNAVWWSKMVTAAGSGQRTALKTLEEELAKDTDTSGRKFSDEERRKREKIIAQRKNELDELSSLKVVKPNTVFDGEMELYLGKRKIVLKDWGKANSPHDVTIYLPDDQILFTGDIVVQSPLPYTGASWPVPWVKVLKQIENMPVKKIVLGHGPIQNDLSYVKQVRSFFEDAMTRVEELIREGKTLPEIQKQINLNDHLKNPWNKDQEAINDFKITVEILVERIWRGIRGQG